MTTITDWSGATFTIPADADGATTATWTDEDGAALLTANAWHYPAEGLTFIPADAQGMESDTIDDDGQAIGQWVDASAGLAAVLLDGAPVRWIG